MSAIEGVAPTFTFHKFGLMVTGESESAALPSLFRSLMEHGNCTFEFFQKIDQLRAKTSQKHPLKVVNTDKTLPDKDAAIGFDARRYLSNQKDGYTHHVILIDDLEGLNENDARNAYERYRVALVKINPKDEHRVSIHYLINMLEAYYFVNTDALNSFVNPEGLPESQKIIFDNYSNDVEDMPHPKSAIKSKFAKNKYRAFNEKQAAQEIIPQLNVPLILSNPDTCAGLRTLFKWCWGAIGEPHEERFCFEEGKLYEITRYQPYNASGKTP